MDVRKQSEAIIRSCGTSCRRLETKRGPDHNTMSVMCYYCDHTPPRHVTLPTITFVLRRLIDKISDGTF